MNVGRLNEIKTALESKKASEPCPRCAKTAFSIVGESEIIVKRTSGGLLSSETKMAVPVVVVACDNCGYISALWYFPGSIFTK